MNIKQAKPYLDLVIGNPNNESYQYQSPKGIEYQIVFYKTSEFESPVTLVATKRLTGSNWDYNVIVDGAVSWEETCKLPLNVKTYIERLVNLFSFL